mgnify:CR=1 FL=1
MKTKFVLLIVFILALAWWAFNQGYHSRDSLVTGTTATIVIDPRTARVATNTPSIIAEPGEINPSNKLVIKDTDNKYLSTTSPFITATEISCTPSHDDLKYQEILKQHGVWLEARQRADKELNAYIDMERAYADSLIKP